METVENRRIKKSSIKNKVKEKEVKTSRIKLPNVLQEILDFYKKNLRKKHIIVYIISLIIFFVFLAMFISSIDVTHSIETIAETVEESKNDPGIFSIILKQTIPSIFLIIFAGITPFVYLSVIGFVYPYILAQDIASIFLINTHAYSVIFMTLGDIIKILGISLAMVTGFYYCSLSTKKFRYSQRSSFGMYDLKKHLYELRKNEKKLKEIEEEKKNKDLKNEKLNVKVPYFMLLKLFIISLIIAIIGTLITAI